MRASQQIKDFIGRQEGCRLTSYKPLSTDRWTIGYGFTYYDENTPVAPGEVISHDSANEMLSEKVDSVAERLGEIPQLVTQQQFDAVVSLAYNIGVTAFTESETGKDFYCGQNISDRFLSWNKSGGKVLMGLIVRRTKEKAIYDEGDYNDNV
jgi:lysozyme